jgi:uncharacterized membrane protein YgcG
MVVFAVRSPAIAQEKSYVYERMDVNLTLQPNGTLDVAETLKIRYTGGPITFANRGIPFKRLDNIADIKLTEGQLPYKLATSGKQSGTFVVERGGDKVNVTWYYVPTSNATRTFILRYRVDGTVRVNDKDKEVWWIAVFPDRSVPVQASSVKLQLPARAIINPNDVTLPAASGQVSIKGNTVQVVRDTPLAGGESLDLRLRFPADLVQSEKPAWQEPSSPVVDNDWGSIFITAFFTCGIILWFLLIAVIVRACMSGGSPSSRSDRHSHYGYYGGGDSGGGGGGGGGGGDGGGGSGGGDGGCG